MMLIDEPLPRSGVLLEYRGQRYEQRAIDPDSPYERLLVPSPGWSKEDFPDATDFSDDPTDPWVAIGGGAIDAVYDRTVRGQWKGCDVTVGSLEKPGSDRVIVHYTGHDPRQAHVAGFISNPYQYWYAAVDPADVEVIEVVDQLRS